ncbi:unnamed protein product, partial [Ectocarpus sp. 12 AP-2014]
NTLCIPFEKITFFGFFEGGDGNEAFVATKTTAEGSIAKAPSYGRFYDPSDLGAGGLITVFVPPGHEVSAVQDGNVQEVADGDDSRRKNKMQENFSPDLFRPSDIVDERGLLRKL